MFRIDIMSSDLLTKISVTIDKLDDINSREKNEQGRLQLARWFPESFINSLNDQQIISQNILNVQFFLGYHCAKIGWSEPSWTPTFFQRLFGQKFQFCLQLQGDGTPCSQSELLQNLKLLKTAITQVNS